MAKSSCPFKGRHVNKARLLLSFLVLWVGAIGFAHAQNYCSAPANIRVGFFNGVANTWKAADRSREKLTEIYGSTAANGASISYELYYNTTQRFGDFVETFEQRLREQDAIFNGKFYLFYEAINGGGEFTDAIKAVVPAFAGFMGSMFNYVEAKLVSILTETAALVGDINNIEPNTFAVHAGQIDNLIAAGERFVVIAHSQGNLFANRAHEYYKSKAPASTSRVVHIAPASAITKGPWTLAYQDFVINALRITGSVVDNTTMIPDYIVRKKGLNGRVDISGHGLLEIYLNPSLPTRARIDEHVNRAISELAETGADSSAEDCIKITRVSCSLSTVQDGIPVIEWNISGVASSKHPLSIIWASSSPFLMMDGIRVASSCDGWTGTAFAPGVEYCAKREADTNKTIWHSFSVSPLDAWELTAFIYRAPSIYFNQPSLPIIAAERIAVPSCPGTYYLN